MKKEKVLGEDMGISEGGTGCPRVLTLETRFAYKKVLPISVPHWGLEAICLPKRPKKA